MTHTSAQQMAAFTITIINQAILSEFRGHL